MTINVLLIPVIFCLFLLFGYLVAGTCVRYQRGIRTCPEMLPNYIFWRGIMLTIFRGFMCVVTLGKYRPAPERVVAVMPQMPSQFFRRETQAFHQLPDMDDLDDDEFQNEPSVPAVRF